jgi:hypothetical protein
VTVPKMGIKMHDDRSLISIVAVFKLFFPANELHQEILFKVSSCGNNMADAR